MGVRLVRKEQFETIPQVGLWALKSPQIMNGSGKDWKRDDMSARLVLWEGGCRWSRWLYVAGGV